MQFSCFPKNRFFWGVPAYEITIQLYSSYSTFRFVFTEKFGITLTYQRYEDYYPKTIDHEIIKRIALGKDKRYKIISKELMNFCYLRMFGV